MNRIIFIFSIIFICNFNASSQNSLDDYKYVIVPTNFDFLKGQDKYQLNSLTEFLFNKYGYTAFLQDEILPIDLNENGCLALYVDVKKRKGGLLKTKVQIELRDCNNRIVHSSRIGETREKDFSKAYNLALRDAFVTYQAITYAYRPNEAIISQRNTEENGNEVAIKENEQSKAKIENLQKEIEELKAAKELKEETKAIAVIEKPKENLLTTSAMQDDNVDLLYAQPINNGFQIVDTTPKKVMVLYFSGVPDTFIVKDRDAIVYKRGDVWVLAENDGSNLRSEALNIKF